MSVMVFGPRSMESERSSGARSHGVLVSWKSCPRGALQLGGWQEGGGGQGWVGLQASLQRWGWSWDLRQGRQGAAG